MTDGALLSDADLGLSYPTASPDAGMDDHPLTVHLARPAPVPSAPPAAAQPAGPAAGPAPPPSQDGGAGGSGAPKLFSDEDLGLVAKPDAGPLANAPDDGYLSGAAKGLATAGVKAIGNSVGFVGGIGNFADYLVARAEHAITGKPVDDILANLAKAKQDQEQHAAQTFGIPSWADPRNVLPAPADVSGPILKQTGEYVPTTEPGRLAQTGAEAVLSAVGPGAGAKAGTYADILRGGVAMAPGNFLGGATAQGATDLTGDPLLGMGAGLVGGVAAHAGMSAANKVAGPAVMGIPGIDNAPVIGPSVAAARDNAAGARLLAQSSDPDSLRAWAAAFDQAKADPQSAVSGGYSLRPEDPAVTSSLPNDPGRFRYDIVKDGTPVGRMNVSVDGDTATINNIVSNAAPDDVRGNLGTKAIIQVMRDFSQRHPEVTTIGGNRISGARQQGGYVADAAGTPTQVAVPAPLATVPNSPKTLAATIGNDRGLFQAEKDARGVDNLPFNAIDDAQSAAQQGAIRSVQPTGDVFRPGQVIRQRLDAIDAASQAVQDRLAAAHQDAVSRRTAATQAFADQQRGDLADRTIARGQASGDAKIQADAATQAEHDRLVQVFQDAHDKALQQAVDAAKPLHTDSNAEDLGATLRSAQEEVRAGVKQAHNELYKVVDPNGDLALVATPVRDKAIQIGSQLKADGANFDPAEAEMFRRAAALPDVASYRMLHSLDKDVGAAMSKERRGAGETPAWARLTQLKGAVKDAMTKAADNQAAHEARMVEAGVMPAEDGLEARLSTHWGINLDGRTAHSSASLARTGTGAVGFSGDRAAGGFSADRTGRAPEGRVGQAPSGPGVPEAPLQPNFDEAAAGRLRAANAAYAEYAKTYKNPIVAPGLRTSGYAGQYQIPDAAFIKRAVVSGDRGYEVAKAHLAAAGNDPRAVAAMQDGALAPLRKNMPPIGNLHPNALARWKENYGGVLRALDAATPGFSSRFDTAAGATQALLDAGLEQKRVMADFQRNAARQAVLDNITRRQDLGQATQADRAQVSSLLAERAAEDRAALAQSRAETSQGAAQAKGIVKEAHNAPAGRFASSASSAIAPTEVENVVGGMLKTGTGGASRLRALVASVAKDPDALAGLRKAGVDWMVRHFQNAEGKLSGASFIDFIRDNRDTLKELYPTAQVSMLGAIARDAEVNARWRTQTAIKGGSDTFKNGHGFLTENGKSIAKHTSMITIAAEAMREGFDRGGIEGAALAAAGAATAYLLNSLRSAGIKSVSKLYQEALADPEKAQYLISKMPATPEGGKLRSLTGLLRRELILGPILTRPTEERS